MAPTLYPVQARKASRGLNLQAGGFHLAGFALVKALDDLPREAITLLLTTRDLVAKRPSRLTEATWPQSHAPPRRAVKNL
jgi:hypothetical protein